MSTGPEIRSNLSHSTIEALAYMTAVEAERDALLLKVADLRDRLDRCERKTRTYASGTYGSGTYGAG